MYKALSTSSGWPDQSAGAQGRAGYGPAEVIKEENAGFQTFMRNR